ncbi:RmlC-like jelly roll fold [Vigna unguiculata]|uniref:RmlC-like jelly roll fold n=1 Tax=Vigna unguiculata TaxID=3917 RepID=A0A4D6L415_VIGUN|nr:RmlC-like jelly roll fold [Vigna unguiculata]
MAIPSFFLTVLALSLSVILAAATSTFQDFCVADPQEKVLVNGLACKDPKLVEANDIFFSAGNKGIAMAYWHHQQKHQVKQIKGRWRRWTAGKINYRRWTEKLPSTFSKSTVKKFHQLDLPPHAANQEHQRVTHCQGRRRRRRSASEVRRIITNSGDAVLLLASLSRAEHHGMALCSHLLRLANSGVTILAAGTLAVSAALLLVLGFHLFSFTITLQADVHKTTRPPTLPQTAPATLVASPPAAAAALATTSSPFFSFTLGLHVFSSQTHKQRNKNHRSKIPQSHRRRTKASSL